MESSGLLEHWQDEGDFCFLYQQLAKTDKDRERKGFFARMAAIEQRHQDIFAQLLEKQGVPLPNFSPAYRVRLLALIPRALGSGEPGRAVDACHDGGDRPQASYASGGTGLRDRDGEGPLQDQRAQAQGTRTHGESKSRIPALAAGRSSAGLA